MRRKTVVSGWWRVASQLCSLFTMQSPVLYALVLILLSPVVTSHKSLLWAQSESATLSGRVADPSGAAIVGAEVVLTNMDTNVEQRTKTNNAGLFVFASVHPGPYRVAAGATGFRTLIKENLVLHVQDEIAENFSLPIGSVSETVTVDASGVNINTTDATVSTTIDRNFAENLPLNGRSFQTLILLTPGTVLTDASRGNAGQFSVNGQRSNANSFTVDGVSANTSTVALGGQSFGAQLNGGNPGYTIFGGTQSLTSVDALQEFKIQTSTYAPEFGRQPGGQVSVLTRSGTNQFHGTAFDYFRNEVLDANDWFNDQQGLPKGKERQNDFGGTFGGSIVKDRTFFFISYEGLRLLQPSTGRILVPSLRLRQEAAPTFQTILNSWPIPDGPEIVFNGMPTGSAPYTQSVSQPTNMDAFSIRLDQTLGKTMHLFGRYSRTPSSNASAFANNLFKQSIEQHAVTIGLDTIILSSLNNEVRVNYTTNDLLSSFNLFLQGGAKGFDTSILFPSPLAKGPDQAGWGLFLFDRYVVSAGAQGHFSQRQINVVDNLTLSLGRHQLRWGIDYRRLLPLFSPVPLSASYAVLSESDLQAGIVSVANTSSQIVAHPIFSNFSTYFQDAWKASGRLTLTYGLRWDLNPAPGERNGIFPLNVIGLDNPTTATLAPLNSQPFKTTYNNFAPRLGVAYQLNTSPGHELVLRAGFGVFYDLNSEASVDGFFNMPPFQSQSQNSSNVSFPVPNGILSIPPVPTPVTPPFPTIRAVDPNLKLPYTLQWNVAVEQALGKDQSLTASYVASAGNRLLRSDTLLNFSPAFTNVIATRNSAASRYESLQLQYNRRLSRSVQALASYTYSHSIDDASNGEDVSFAGSAFLNPNLDRASSDFDLRHSFRGAVTYMIPTPLENVALRTVFGGWSVSSIGIAQTALPVNVVGGFFFIQNTQVQLRPDVIPGVPFYVNSPSAPGGRQFNPAAFQPGPTDSSGNPVRQGTLGRNALRGLGAWQMDFAIHRQFNLTERLNLQFRGEFFNVFNHPNFDGIDNNISDGSFFGQAHTMLNQGFGGAGGAGLNSLYSIGGPRSIQLALKLAF